jgi:hypothetical protein
MVRKKEIKKVEKKSPQPTHCSNGVTRGGGDSDGDLPLWSY